MRNLLLVGIREFKTRVTSRGFLLGSIFVPLFFIVLFALSNSFMGSGEVAPGPSQFEKPEAESPVELPLGYIDQAGFIQREVGGPVQPGRFSAFSTLEAAGEALRQGQIEAYYVIPPDYRESGRVRRVSRDLPVAAPDNQAINWLLALNIQPEANPAEVARLRDPFNANEMFYQKIGAENQAGSARFDMLPFLTVMVIMLPLFTSGGYLLQSLAQEKGNRIMEILFSSLRPRQLLAGKLLGLGALALVQYVIWIALSGLALLVSRTEVGSLLSQVDLAPQEALVALPFALGGYALYASLMAGVGALANNLEESRSWIFVITLPMMVPIYLWMLIANSPHAPLVVGMSLFPFSAPFAMLMRMTNATVPAWQVLVSLALLFVTAAGMLLLMARLFRIQVLLSGEGLSLGKLRRALQG